MSKCKKALKLHEEYYKKIIKKNENTPEKAINKNRYNIKIQKMLVLKT